MQKQTQKGSTKQERGGDTTRSSSQGRKLSSGGDIGRKQKGNPEQDETTKSPKAEKKNDNTV
jgi:hypothetical protein